MDFVPAKPTTKASTSIRNSYIRIHSTKFVPAKPHTKACGQLVLAHGAMGDGASTIFAKPQTKACGQLVLVVPKIPKPPPYPPPAHLLRPTIETIDLTRGVIASQCATLRRALEVADVEPMKCKGKRSPRPLPKPPPKVQ